MLHSTGAWWPEVVTYDTEPGVYTLNIESKLPYVDEGKHESQEE